MTPYGYFDGKKCSWIWIDLLQEARNEGVHFQLNSGHRTIAEQWVLYNAHQRDPAHAPLAAYPGTSTHNKIGWVQGVDIGPGFDGAAARRLQAWAYKRGITLRFTVPGENWHLNATADFSKKIKKPFKPLKRGSKGPRVVLLRHRLRMTGYSGRRAKKYGWPVVRPGLPFFTRGLFMVVRHFQHRAGIRADGVVGPVTWNTINRIARRDRNVK